MASGNKTQIAAFMIFFGLTSVWTGIGSFRRKRRVADVASSRTASAAQGLTEFEGFAWHTGTIVKNLVGSDCCLRHIKLQQYVKRGKSGSWETIWTNTNADHFYLVDRTGVVKVITHNSEYDSVITTKSWGNVPKAYQEEVLGLGRFQKTFGGLVGFPPSGWFGGSYRIVEYSLPIGSPVFCQGSFSTPAELGKQINIPGISTFFEMLQKQAKQPAHTMMSLDTNRDGTVCETEVHTAYVVAGQIALQKSAMSDEMGNAPLHGLLQHSKEHALILSGRHQYYLLKKLGFWYMLQIVGGAALVAGGVFTFFT